MRFEPLTLCGVVGSGLIIGAYFANQHGWLLATNPRYSVLNLVGALLILLSLIVAWNLAAAIMETFWAGISLYGLIRNRQ
jgi:hypothetical protein